MENRLGTDFSAVRVHTGPHAARAATELAARAYTVRSHIVFNDAEFAPDTAQGKRLLAHELVHVAQQARGVTAARDASAVVPADDPSEREAERLADAASPTPRPDATTTQHNATPQSSGAGTSRPRPRAAATNAAPTPAGHVQRVPFGEWWARHILGEGTFSAKELADYLTFLDGGSIEDHNDSDNKARVIVGRWAAGAMKIQMPPTRATLLIKEMQSGFTGDDDELAILELLEHMSNSDLKSIFTSIDPDDLNSDFQGAEWGMLKDFYGRRFKGGMAKLLEHVVEPVGEPLPVGPRRGKTPPRGQPAAEAGAQDPTVQEQSGVRCDVKHPENCPTYETWLHQFKGLPTFSASSGHTVIGEKPAPRDTATDLTKDPSVRRPPDIHREGGKEVPRYLPADRFIDGPTEQWVRENLPDNLLRDAYELPSDCADIAVILRHVWLTAHHRREKEGPWELGSGAGEARAEEVRTLIVMEVGPGVERFLNPYANEKGKPLRKYSDLEPLLHAGDVLVWDHTIGSGHVQTIIDVERDPTGKILSLPVLQGNQPISREDAEEIARTDPAEQKKKTPAERKRTPSVEELRAAPGRRIERSVARLPLPKNRDEDVWSWHDEQKTFLIAAGPPSSAGRPPAKVEKGKRLPRRVTDWVPSLRAANLKTIDSVFEGMILELRAALEGQAGATDEDARALGTAAGERLWQLLRESGDLQEGGSSLFRLERLRAQVHAVRQTACVTGAAEGEVNEKTARRCSLTPFDALDHALVEAARGVSGVDFTRKQAKNERIVNVLLTGFDPFSPGGSQPPSAGDWNPSGAAVRQLDGQTVAAAASVNAAVEGVVLPVSFTEFRAGLVESIVDQHKDADAILTVSLDPNLEPNDPVRLEQFAVGVHSGGSQPAEATPTAKGAPGTPAIFEARADTAAIAGETERASSRRDTEIPKPDIGTKVRLTFSTGATAAAALKALGEPPQSGSTVDVASEAGVRQIATTMHGEGAPGSTTFTFTVKGQSFSASLVSGPGGSFLSNEVSFRVLRRLSEQGRAATISFHTHVPPGTENAAPIPEGTSSETVKERSTAVSKARAVLTRLVDTLKRLIAAVARRVGTGNPASKP